MARALADLTLREHTLTGEKLSLLAVFAHPEDESFGPAGTLAKYASEGVQVSLVTTTRKNLHHGKTAPVAPLDALKHAREARDRLCSCRTTGIRRACYFDILPGDLDKIDESVIEDQLVRLVRELQPQVIVTFGPDGLSGDKEHQLISRVTTAAFRSAGNPDKFPHHFREGLGTYSPQKLYYCVLPASVVSQWGAQGLFSVPDETITTTLDVSAFTGSVTKALYCQRSEATDFIRWLTKERQVHWNMEYYLLVESRLNKKPRREKDLFAGLR
ncbi:MAG: PIG-L family deacetylase [Chloroflexi bacterium]|nr:PIG-L family deacetylase [Chloroflexota bacterium]